MFFITYFIHSGFPKPSNFLSVFSVRKSTLLLTVIFLITKYILEMIENALTNNTREKTISDRNDVHIEHIMPRELLRKRNKVIENSRQKKQEHEHLNIQCLLIELVTLRCLEAN
ncbi:DUF1524 domain-containing protein [Peribacillus frigoritolerans]|uniref:GmrSD restriction endonuclease domain-containing protein n=1 Tax=Peribacillus frigoritolerans TaxID=450367 RepID=UPI0039A3DEBA